MNTEQTDRLSVGIVGLGSIGFGYDSGLSENYVLTHARAAASLQTTSLAWGVDPDEEKRTDFSRAYSAKGFRALEDVANEPVDIAILATPPESRTSALEMLISMKPRVIILEKPLGNSLSESRDTLKALREAHQPALVNYIRRFCPASVKIQHSVAAGVFQEFRTGIVRYKSGLRSNGSHLVNLVGYLLGDYGEVSARYGTEPGSDDLDPDVFFQLNVSGGSVLFVPVGVNGYAFAEVDLLFENGRIQLTDHAFKASMTTGVHNLPVSGYRELNDMQTVVCNCASRYQAVALNEVVDRLCAGDDFRQELSDAELTELICEAALN